MVAAHGTCIQAEMAMMVMFPSVPLKTLSTMGMSIPKVPQEVPVAKERPTAIRNIMAGSIILNPPAEPSMSWETNTFAPKESVMVLRVQAQQRMRIAGTIALKPSGGIPCTA